MHSFSAVLLTGHVDVVATFRNDIQSEAGEDGESNSNFPHEFSPKINSISLSFLIGVRATLISNRLGAEANGGFLMVGYHKSSAPISLCPQTIEKINVDLTPFKKSHAN